MLVFAFSPAVWRHFTDSHLSRSIIEKNLIYTWRYYSSCSHVWRKKHDNFIVFSSIFSLVPRNCRSKSSFVNVGETCATYEDSYGREWKKNVNFPITRRNFVNLTSFPIFFFVCIAPFFFTLHAGLHITVPQLGVYARIRKTLTKISLSYVRLDGGAGREKEEKLTKKPNKGEFCTWRHVCVTRTYATYKR